MSETEQKEIEVVSGVIKGIIVKGVDKWQVEVQPDGSQYTKKLWTKDAELVAALPAKVGQQGAFVCGASYWTNDSGAQVRSLWIQQEGTEGVTIEKPAERVATPGSAPQARTYTPDLKDRMIVRQTCLKAAAELVAGDQRQEAMEDVPLEVMRAAQRFETWVYRDISDVPFDQATSPVLSDADESIPF